MNHAFVSRLEQHWCSCELPVRPLTEHRCEECDKTDLLLGGRSWIDVMVNFPSYCHDVFPLLSADAKKYYLPSFMGSDILDGNGQSISVEHYLMSDEFVPGEWPSDNIALILEWVDLALDPVVDSKSISEIINKLAYPNGPRRRG